METYGQIAFEVYWTAKNGPAAQETLKQIWKAMFEEDRAGWENVAQIVIEEFKRRHMGKRFIDAWHRAERGEEVNEAHITLPAKD